MLTMLIVQHPILYYLITLLMATHKICPRLHGGGRSGTETQNSVPQVFITTLLELMTRAFSARFCLCRDADVLLGRFMRPNYLSLLAALTNEPRTPQLTQNYQNHQNYSGHQLYEVKRVLSLQMILLLHCLGLAVLDSALSQTYKKI